MSFLKAYLAGYTVMALTSNDLDRLKYAPQRVEDGEVFNFNNKSMFGKVDGVEDQVILDADRVNNATRFTAALKRDYQAGMDNFIASLVGGDAVAEEETTADVKLDDKILEVVKVGDKKAFRGMRQEIKDQWFALDDAEVTDAILDLSDAVADKDVEFAQEILDGLGEVADETPTKEEPEVKEKEETKKSTELTEEESEIIEDIKSAIDDGDEKDFNELIEELKEVNPDLADEWSTAFNAAEPEAEETKEDEEDLVDEIVEDLEAAIKDRDMDEAKECLEELKEEVGEDSDLYKEFDKLYAEKLAPKKRERRSRRGK